MNLRALARKLRPEIHVRVHRQPPDDFIISVRWRGWGWDHIRSKGYKFTQWGRPGQLPLRFLCRCPKDNPKLPVFLYSSKWKPTFARNGLVIGRTFKPYDVGSFWRKADACYEKLSPSQRIRARVYALGLDQ